MTTDLATLWHALLSQEDELGSPTLRGMPEAVAQQLSHEAGAEPANAMLAAAAAARLRRLLDHGVPAVAVTRWSTTARREQFRPHLGAISALRTYDGGRVAVFAARDDSASRTGVLWEWRLPDPDHGGQAQRRAMTGLRRPRELVVLDRPVVALDVAEDGTTVIVGDLAGEVVLWRLGDRTATPERLHTGAEVRDVALSPDGRYALALFGDDCVVWDIAGDPAERARMTLTHAHRAVLLDGDTAVIGDFEGRVLLLRPADDAAPVELGRHPAGRVIELTAGAGSRSVLSTASDDTLLRSPVDGSGATLIGRHTTPLRGLTDTACGDVVTGDMAGRVLRWPAAGGPAKRIGAHDRAVYTAAVGADGTVFTGGKEGLLLRWSIGAEAPGTQSPNVWTLDVDAGSDVVVAGGRDGAYLWSLPDDGPGSYTKIFDGSVTRAAVLAGGAEAVVANASGVLLVLDLAGSRPPDPLPGHGWSSALVAMPGERAFVSAGQDGRIVVWRCVDDGWSGTAVGTSPDGVAALGISESLAVTATPSGRLSRWNLAHPGPPVDLGEVGAPVKQIVFSPDGTSVHTGDEKGRLLTWPVHLPDTPPVPVGPARDALARNLQEFGDHRVGPASVGRHSGGDIQALVVADDGTWIATTGDDGTLCWWTPGARSDEPLARLVPSSIPLRLACWRNGLLVADRNGGLSYVELWRREKGQQEETQRPPTGRVVVADQSWMRTQGSSDLLRLREALAPGQADHAVMACPNIAPLFTFRTAAERLGWKILDTPPDPAERYPMIIGYLARLGAGATATVVSGDPTLLALLNTDVQVVNDLSPYPRR